MVTLTPSYSIDDGYDFMVVSRTLKKHQAQPATVQLARCPKRAVSIVDPVLQDCTQSYLYAVHFQKDMRIFSTNSRRSGISKGGCRE